MKTLKELKEKLNELNEELKSTTKESDSCKELLKEKTDLESTIYLLEGNLCLSDEFKNIKSSKEWLSKLKSIDVKNDIDNLLKMFYLLESDNALPFLHKKGLVLDKKDIKEAIDILDKVG